MNPHSLGLGDDAKNRLIQHFYELWIEPELRKRFGDAGPPSNFRIYSCLVRLPRGRSPIVEFNNEIAWELVCENAGFEPGQPVYLHDVRKIDAVIAPSFEGRPVPFMFLCRLPDGTNFRLLFDFSVIEDDPIDEGQKWQFSDAVAEYMNAVFFEASVHAQERCSKSLAAIGFWPIPALMPYPMTECARLVQSDQPEAARQVIVKHCSPVWLETQLERWLTVPELATRRKLLIDALAAHRAGHYSLTIHALLPQIEGIVSDRLSRVLPQGDLKWRIESKLRQFKTFSLDDDKIGFALRRVIELTIDFIDSGPVLADFEKWIDSPDRSFPNRHVVGHGKYDEELFTEENSIKAFLLMGTLANILAVTRPS